MYERNDENNVPLGKPIINNCSWQEASDAEISELEYAEKQSVCIVLVNLSMGCLLTTEGQIIASWWKNLIDTTLASDQCNSPSKKTCEHHGPLRLLGPEKGTVSSL